MYTYSFVLIKHRELKYLIGKPVKIIPNNKRLKFISNSTLVNY